MCEIDYDGDQPKVWREKWQTTRKTRECAACYLPILPGSRCVSHFSVDSLGTALTEYCCEACGKGRDEFSQAHDGVSYTPGSFEFGLSLCIEEDEWEHRGDRPYDQEPKLPSRWEQLQIELRDRRRRAKEPPQPAGV